LQKTIISMKQLYTCAMLFVSLAASVSSAQAQCSPNPLYNDSVTGLYPLPSSNPSITGQVGEPFVFDLTAVITDDQLEVFLPDLGTNATVIVNNVSNVSMVGLPPGLSFECNPSDCTFTPTNTPACARISGIPTQAGTYNLVVNTLADVVVTSLGSVVFDDFPVSFPGDFFPGNYTITIGTSSVKDAVAGVEQFSITPNIVSSQTTVRVRTNQTTDVDFTLLNHLGQAVRAQKMALHQGDNTLPLDVTNLPAGIYFANIKNGTGTATQRIVVQN
jgi:hypothetical protein